MVLHGAGVLHQGAFAALRCRCCVEVPLLQYLGQSGQASWRRLMRACGAQWVSAMPASTWVRLKTPFAATEGLCSMETGRALPFTSWCGCVYVFGVLGCVFGFSAVVE